MVVCYLEVEKVKIAAEKHNFKYFERFFHEVLSCNIHISSESTPCHLNFRDVLNLRVSGLKKNFIF